METTAERVDVLSVIVTLERQLAILRAVDLHPRGPSADMAVQNVATVLRLAAHTLDTQSP